MQSQGNKINNDLQNTSQNTIDRSTRTPHNKPEFTHVPRLLWGKFHYMIYMFNVYFFQSILTSISQRDTRTINLLGQAWVLQDVDLDVEPTQALPLYCGAGFVHDLLLDLVPPPHDTLHDPHDDHDVNPP